MYLAPNTDTIDAAWADAVSVISALATSAAPTDDSNNWVVNTALGQYQPGSEGWIEAAALADIGLGANIASDGTYPQATVDADGAILDGANDYQNDFGSDLPPVDGGYWSVTVYDADGTIYLSTRNAFYYTEAIGGVYALGSIQFPSDSDVTLYLQNEAPGSESLERFWLPVPNDTFNPFLPTFADATSVDPPAVNGTLNQACLNGDNAAAFEVELLGQGFAAFDNVLGAYEIDQDEVIVDARLVSSNTNADVGRTVLVDGIDKGDQLGFFLVQDGSDEFLALNGEPLLTFVAQGGAPASVSGGAELSLFVSGQALERPTWHSFSPELNSDGLEHALSGVEPGGKAIVVGFEDLAGGGDHEYEDVTLRVTAGDALLSQSGFGSDGII